MEPKKRILKTGPLDGTLTAYDLNTPALPATMEDAEKLLKVVQTFCKDRRIPFIFIMHVPVKKEGGTWCLGRLAAPHPCALVNLVRDVKQRFEETFIQMHAAYNPNDQKETN